MISPDEIHWDYGGYKRQLLLCPFCDEISIIIPNSKCYHSLDNNRIYHQRICKMGHTFYSMESTGVDYAEVLENFERDKMWESELKREAREIAREERNRQWQIENKIRKKEREKERRQQRRERKWEREKEKKRLKREKIKEEKRAIYEANKWKRGKTYLVKKKVGHKDYYKYPYNAYVANGRDWSKRTQQTIKTKHRSNRDAYLKSRGVLGRNYGK